MGMTAAEKAQLKLDRENAVLAKAAQLDSSDHSEAAEHTREVAASIQDHRDSAAQRD
ncbi:hypothetical protein AB0425_17660 [Actinosynnema sp. NPDC051121]